MPSVAFRVDGLGVLAHHGTLLTACPTVLRLLLLRRRHDTRLAHWPRRHTTDLARWAISGRWAIHRGSVISIRRTARDPLMHVIVRLLISRASVNHLLFDVHLRHRLGIAISRPLTQVNRK